MRKFFYLVVFAAFGAIAAYVMIVYYSFIFSKTVHGQVFQIERVTDPTMVIGRAGATNVLHSFAIALQSKDGSIITGSTEDRQWAIIQRGMCVEAKFYPYPPWDLEKGGTYFNVRMLAMKPCPAGMPPLDSQITPEPPPATPEPTSPQ